MSVQTAFASPLWGVVRYEFLMQFRRRALWIALGLASIFIIVIGNNKLNGLNVGFAYQLLMPLVAGYFLSDRLYRDLRLGTSQIIGTSGLTNTQYIWGKYAGITGATIFITVVLLVVLTLWTLLTGTPAPNENFFTLIAPALIVTISTYLFVGAFCLGLPALLPLRLYQILFSCYWLWAFQSRFPSVAGTPLSPNGQFPLSLIFRDHLHQFLRGIEPGSWSPEGYYLIHGPFGWVFEDTPAMTLLNQGLLLGLAVLALLATRFYLDWKEAHS